MIPLKAPSPSPLTFSLALLFPLAAYAEGDLPGIEAVRAAKAPVIDGVLNDACWRGEPTLRDFRMAGDPAAAHPEQTQGWICYGKANLYLAFRCRVHDAGAYRKRLAESPGEVKSGIRVQIDWKNARAPNLYEEYLLNGNGTTGYLFNPGTGRGRKVRPIDELKIDALIPASVGFMSTLRPDYIESAVSFTEDSYVIEAAVPFAMMHLSSETSNTWAFNVHRIHDADLAGEEGGSDARSYWGAGSVDPKLFGALELGADLSQYYWDLHFVPPQPGDQAIEVRLGNATGHAFAGEIELTVTRRSADSHSHRPDGETFVYRQPVALGAGEERKLLFEHTVNDADVEARYQFALSDAGGHPVILGSTSKRDLTPGDDGPAPEPTEQEAQRGYLLYRRPYTVPMTYRSVPKREEIVTELGLFGCPGEYVPVTFSLYPLQPLSDVRLRAGNLTGPAGAVIPSSAIEIRRVEHHPLWQEKWIAYSFKAQENLLRRFDRLDLPARRNQRFWLTAKLADGQKPGAYTGTVTINSNKGAARVPLKLTVLPFELAGVEDMGYFMYANGALTGDPGMARRVARDMREHGMTTATVYYFNEIGHGTGEHKLIVDEPVGYSKETGYRVDPSRGMSYAQVIDMLVEAGFARQVPLIEMYSGGMGSGYKPELVAELDGIFKERGWPEVLYYLHDEFDMNEERTRRARRRFAELRKHGLGDLKYTTAITAHEEMRERTDALAPLYDVWILGTPSPDLVARGRELGKELWSYGWNYSHAYGTADLRHYFGRYLWKSGLTGASMWCYNHGRFRGRFWSYIDAKEVAFSPAEHKLMFSYAWVEDGEIIPTVKWEAIREGIDDYRYLRTLEQYATAAAEADNSKERAAGEAGLQLLGEIREGVAPVVTKAAVADHDKPSLLHVDDERRRVAEAILRILKAQGRAGGEWVLTAGDGGVGSPR